MTQKLVTSWDKERQQKEWEEKERKKMERQRKMEGNGKRRKEIHMLETTVFISNDRVGIFIDVK